MDRPEGEEKAIFIAALDRAPGAERAAFLDVACGGRAELRARVEALIAALGHADEVLGPAGGPPVDPTVVAVAGPPGAGAATAGLDPTRADASRPGPDDETRDLTPTRDAGRRSADDASGAVGGLGRGTTVRYFGDYEIRRELGRGGMGVVYEARQASLNRPVALKMIRSGLLADGDELRRFRNEAETVALLDHPGIVPVYEVGEHDGQQYFTMKLVPGGSLVTRLEGYKDDPRAAATLVAEAAGAVAHAHARGILHRDLKPANILVDAEGHPHVTDFGLAKRSEADAGLTRSGAIMGTPAYMSPEQASGRRGAVTTASDVYGLGAVLYALLTGRAPFVGDSAVETIDAVRDRPPDPPRRVNAAVPRGLETICLKCLEKDPRRRYATAQALADDLNAWLDRRPIAARRVGAAERAWLWCRRRPAVAALSAAVLLAVVAGTATVIAVQARANDALRAANRRVEQRYELAVEAIRTFHTGVSGDFLLKQDQFKALRDRLLKSATDFYGRLGVLMGRESDLASRRALLRARFEVADLTATVGRKEDALAAHLAVLEGREALANEPGADPETADLARSLVAVASIRRQFGQLDEASASYRRALALLDRPGARPTAEARGLLADCHTGLGMLLIGAGGGSIAEARAEHLRALALARELVDENPGVTGHLGRLAECHYDLALVAIQDRKWREAEAEYRQAADLYRKLAHDHPADVDFRMKLADCHSGLGKQLFLTGTVAAAEAEMREELRVCRELVHDYPGVTDTRMRLAECHNDRFFLMHRLRRLAEQAAEAREAVALYQGLVEEHPTVTDYRVGLAMYRSNLAGALSRAGKLEEAEAEYRRVMAVYQKLADDLPAVTFYRRMAVGIHMEIGLLRTQAGKTAEAEAEYRRAADLYQQLADEHPTATEYRSALASTRVQLARLLRQAGKTAEAEAGFRRAADLYQRIADEHPATENRKSLEQFVLELATFLSQSGKPAEAEAEYRRAVDISKKLADEHPGEAFFGTGLATDHLLLGGFLWLQARRPAEAEAEYRRALAIAQRVADEHPGSVESRGSLAGHHDGLAWLLSETGKLAEAESQYRQALAIRRKNVEADPAVPGLLSRVAETHRKLGALLGRANDPARAEGEFGQALAIQRKLVDDHPTSPSFLVDLARTWAEVGRTRRAGGRRAEAVSAFRQAVAAMERVPRPTSDHLYDLACFEALISGALDRPGASPSVAERRDSADRAMHRLHGAVASGARNLAHMRSDPDLDPLRARPDFQRLMMDLAMPADPFVRAQ